MVAAKRKSNAESAVRFVDGGPARPWWAYTAERKRELAKRASR
jgi:hypothetical protein